MQTTSENDSGDEFCVILRELINAKPVERVAEKILTALASPFHVLNNMVHLSASIGIAFSPQDANTSEDLLKKADQAMYAAKSAGRNQFSFFSPPPPNKLLARYFHIAVDPCHGSARIGTFRGLGCNGTENLCKV
ncbi:diguanylate cyclase domain-containing protein [Lamprocystis purpurea]|uniref:diguanylate cyclase domain-containing protein n=1 Tax=Lamprocystis purpurea TaxID=61598 RepID=UPI0012F8893E|nr:GGDEF domain-containing protein [Lamprocystis purpurea]